MRDVYIPKASGKLFLDSMPGGYDSLEVVIENLKTENVTAIVVLPERREIERQQPEYAALLRSGGPDFAKCIFLPCVDFGLPEAGTDVFVAHGHSSCRATQARSPILRALRWRSRADGNFRDGCVVGAACSDD